MKMRRIGIIGTKAVQSARPPRILPACTWELVVGHAAVPCGRGELFGGI